MPKHHPLGDEFIRPDGNQTRISYEERKTGRHGNSLAQKDHWAMKIRHIYYNERKFKYLYNSGRDYNGADAIFKDIEKQRFYDQIDGVTEIKIAYLYIISKTINDKIFFKVGVGGTGKGARLGGAQTFLITGLGDDVGFRVHYVFFFNDYFVEPYFRKINLALEVEQNVHENLRHYFRTANLTFPSKYESEWYLIPSQDKIFFLGIVFDLIASNQYPTQAIWKLTEGDSPKTDIDSLPLTWSTRMEEHPKFRTNMFRRFDKRSIKLRPGIKINYNDKEHEGSIPYYKRVFFIGKGNIEKAYTVRIDKYEFIIVDMLTNLQVTEHMMTAEDNENDDDKSTSEKDNGKMYAAIKFIDVGNESLDIIQTLLLNELQNASFLIPNNTDVCFYIEIYDLLSLIKIDKYSSNDAFKNWELKLNYEYHHNLQNDEKVEYVADDDFLYIAPKWYYDNMFQGIWSRILLDEQHRFHEDGNFKWESYETYMNVERKITMMNRRQIVGDNEPVPNSDEAIPLFNLMYLLDANNILLKMKNKTILTNILFENNSLDFNNFKIKIRDDYFIRYNNKRMPVDYNKNGKNITWNIYTIVSAFSLEDLGNWYVVTNSDESVKWCIPEKETIKNKNKYIKSYVEKEKKKDTIHSASKKSSTDTDTQSTTTTNNSRNSNSNSDTRSDRPNNHNDYEDEEREPEIIIYSKYKKGDIFKIIPNKYSQRFPNATRFGEEITSPSSEHYAEVVSVNRNAGTYKIKYFPPWDKNAPWESTFRSQGRNVYREEHNINNIDMVSNVANSRALEKYKSFLLKETVNPKGKTRITRKMILYGGNSKINRNCKKKTYTKKKYKSPNKTKKPNKPKNKNKYMKYMKKTKKRKNVSKK